jgi:nucleoside permease NupC
MELALQSLLGVIAIPLFVFAMSEDRASLKGGPAPFELARHQGQFILAVHALPLILLISALARLLYHWGVLQRVVGLFAKPLQKSFGIGGPLGSVAALSLPRPRAAGLLATLLSAAIVGTVVWR